MKIFMHGLINSRVKDPEIHGRQHKRPQLRITLHRPKVSTFWKSGEPWNRPKLLYDTFFDSLVYRLGQQSLRRLSTSKAQIYHWFTGFCVL